MQWSVGLAYWLRITEFSHDFTELVCVDILQMPVLNNLTPSYT